MLEFVIMLNKFWFIYSDLFILIYFDSHNLELIWYLVYYIIHRSISLLSAFQNNVQALLIRGANLRLSPVLFSMAKAVVVCLLQLDLGNTSAVISIMVSAHIALHQSSAWNIFLIILLFVWVLYNLRFFAWVTDHKLIIIRNIISC